jgi:hypothetical protein
LGNWEVIMTALNIVRFRVKPGHEEHFIAAHRGRKLGSHGFRGGALVKTGERSYCIVGEWTSLQRMVDARPKMIEILDTFRNDLEDLGAELGVTDPVSGEVVVKLAGAPKPRPKKPRAKPLHRGRK